MPVLRPQSPAHGRALVINNVTDGETVHQRCILIKGQFTGNGDSEGHVTVNTENASGEIVFPTQTWPIVAGRVKVLAMLTPGRNKIVIDHPDEGKIQEIELNYVPLLDVPPLHLAIMVAKDSPLMIDCPPAKYGGVSSTHSSLEAAIAKFRMTAYMWQALTAEDMRMKGLGRRAFRLEEEWTQDTTSMIFLNAANESALFDEGAMRSTAKIHLIRSDKTTKEIRDPHLAQQNNSARNKDKLHEIFSDELKKHGAPFEPSSHPVVAGLILDSHYSMDKKLIVGHAALGNGNAKGLSLGMFGSHLTYSWPRFLEEVSSCLTDVRCPGDTVGNDCGDCGTLWEACSIGQGAFLHEVGHAFGAPHTTGIMARGYAQHWPRNFLSQTAHCSRFNQDGFVVVDGETENEACWDVRDALSFSQLPHFRLPNDKRFTKLQLSMTPSINVVDIETDHPTLEISSEIGIAQIQINDTTLPSPNITSPETTKRFTFSELKRLYPEDTPLKMSILGMNGTSKSVSNIWRLFQVKNYFRIPGSRVLLKKQSVTAKYMEENDETFQGQELWSWATLLSRRGEDGSINRATKVDVRTGAILDGAYVHFESGRRVNCGPRVGKGGHAHTFGGHAHEVVALPEGVEIEKIEVGRAEVCLHGLRLHLRDGSAGGALHGGYSKIETCVLAPPSGERVVGFYGRSFWQFYSSAVVEFGIITAPKDFELPEAVYSMSELQNTDGGIGGLEEQIRSNGGDYDDDEEMTEDED